jgi:hypothetical protein
MTQLSLGRFRFAPFLPELGVPCAAQSCEARLDRCLWALRPSGNAKKRYAARFCLTRFSRERCFSFICSVE